LGMHRVAASPWQRPISYFHSHPAVSGETKMAVIAPTPRTPMIWHPVTSSYFQKWNWSWDDAGLITLRRSRPNRIEFFTLWEKRTSGKRSKNGGDGGTGVYMREETTLGVMAADMPYGEFYYFYIVSPAYFGFHHVYFFSSRVEYWNSNQRRLLSFMSQYCTVRYLIQWNISKTCFIAVSWYVLIWLHTTKLFYVTSLHNKGNIIRQSPICASGRQWNIVQKHKRFEFKCV
jgi:hypothetical protein